MKWLSFLDVRGKERNSECKRRNESLLPQRHLQECDDYAYSLRQVIKTSIKEKGRQLFLKGLYNWAVVESRLASLKLMGQNMS